MKITIDTKEDSHSEIQKAIRLLQSLAEHKTSHSNIFEEDSSSTTEKSSEGGLFNMFGGEDSDKEVPKPEPPAVEEKDDVKIMEY